MNLYFLNLTLPKTLHRAMAEHGFIICYKLPSSKDAGTPLVFIRLRRATDLAEFKNLRQLFPQSWIVLIVPDTWLSNSTTVSHLFECKAKNDVCSIKDYPKRFWFIVQSALEHFAHCKQIGQLTKEGAYLHKQIASISDRATSLISQLERNLELAETIQRGLLPKLAPEIPGVALNVKYLPAAGIGGDYYDLFEFGDRKRFGFLLADSQSHGLAAALLSVLLKVRLEEMKERFKESRSFVDFVHRELIQTHRTEMTRLSLLYAILDRSSLGFEFTAAGSLSPILVRFGKVEPIEINHNPPLGGVDHFAYRETRLILKPGDLLILHTDGLEQPIGQRARITQIIEGIVERQGTPDPLAIQNEIFGRVRSFSSKKPLADDITLIQVNVLENTLYLATHSK